MQEYVNKEFCISADEFSRRDLWFAMGYGNAEPDSGVREMAETLVRRLVPCARMKYMYKVVAAEKLSGRTISLDGSCFTPEGIICSYLDGMESACVFVATVGKEFDAAVKSVNAEGDILADFIADSIGTVLAELAVSRLEDEFLPLERHSMSYSPGYCNWNICQQQLFFQLFPPEPCGIRLSESSLMSPEKSVSGFFAMGESLTRQPYHCSICKNVRCYKRRNAGIC